MNEQPIRVLLLEDNSADARLFQALLTVAARPLAAGPTFELTWADRLAAGLDHLTAAPYDVILADLTLPDSAGLETLLRLRAHAPQIPIVVLTGQDDEELAVQAMRQGAQDYLVKDQVNGILLTRALRYALERWRLEEQLRTNEARYRAMFDHLGSGVAVYRALPEGEDFVFVDFNPTAERITRVSREQVVGRRLLERFPHMDKAGLLAALRRVWQTGQPEHLPPFYYQDAIREGWRENYIYKLPSGEVVAIFDDVTERQRAEGALRRRVAQLALLNDISSQIAAVLELDQVLERAVRLVQAAFGYHHVAIFLRDRTQDVMALRACAGEFTHLFSPEHRRKIGEGFVGWVSRHGETLLANDVTAEPRYVNPFPDRLPTRSELSAPIRIGAEIVGVLDVQSPHLHAFDENDVLAMETVAAQIAAAIQNARLYQTVARGKREWELTFDAIPDGIALIGADFRILRINRTLARWLNSTPQALTGQFCYQMFHGSQSPPAICLHCRMLQDHQPQEAEMGLPAQAGTFLVSADPLFNEQGEFSASVHVFRDITARKQAAEDLRRYSNELAALYQIGRAITSTLSLDEVLNRVTAEAQAILGVDMVSILLPDPACDELAFAAVTGQAAGLLTGTRLPTTAGIAGWVWRTAQPALVNDAQHDPRFYAHVDHLTGQTTHSLLAAPLQHKGQIIGVIEAVNRADRPFDEHDLALLSTLAGSAASAMANARLYEETARHLAETQVLQEVMQAAASTLDFDQVLARALQAVHRALGIEFLCCMIPDESQGDLAVHPSIIGLQSPPATSLRIPLQGSVTGRVYTTGQPALVADTTEIPDFFALPGMIESRSELAVPVYSGDRVIAILDAGRPQRAAFGEDDLRLFEAIAAQLSLVLANARLYQAEREQRRLVEQSQMQLVQSEKMAALGRLMASIAHEINNPLQSIQGCLTLVQENLTTGADSAEMEGYLSLAGREIDRIAEIVQRMRDFYRPAHEGLQPTHLNAVLDSVLLLSNKKLQHSRVRVERDLAADLPLIQANPDHIKQVLLNLVLNALDAMPPGGTIRVRTSRGQIQPRADAPPQPAVCLEFSDTGVGMSPEAVARVFEPFYTTKEGGTGLGLSISYGIIMAHHGQIAVSSQEGRGTTFTILLPVEQPGRGT